MSSVSIHFLLYLEKHLSHIFTPIHSQHYKSFWSSNITPKRERS